MRSPENSRTFKSLRAQKFQFKAGLMYFSEFFRAGEALKFVKL